MKLDPSSFSGFQTINMFELNSPIFRPPQITSGRRNISAVKSPLLNPFMTCRSPTTRAESSKLNSMNIMNSINNISRIRSKLVSQGQLESLDVDTIAEMDFQ